MKTVMCVSVVVVVYHNLLGNTEAELRTCACTELISRAT